MANRTVSLTVRAERDLEAIYAYITRDEPGGDAQAACRWYFGLRDAIRGLASLPFRGGRVSTKTNYRQLLYGTLPHTYRVIYRVQGEFVYIVHVRHGARKGSGLR